jgi:hypothetical protein
MTSSPDTFSSVEPKSAVAFPAVEPTLKELREQSQQALSVGIVGALLGAIGIILGFLGMRARRS